MLADRMASVGTLAAGVAHEINNPLAFILANLEFALTELRVAAADPEVLRALGEARDRGLRVREIVRDLKAFSRADAEAHETLDLRRVLQSALGLAQNEIRHRARLEVDVGEIPPVVGSEHRLGQVFLNLLINAAQAIPEGRAAENVVRAVTATARDGRALVEISDSGSGIPAEVLPRIFDPFFTTKPVGVGTGLGLSICHGIVSGLGGEILVESAPGKGSTFRVFLPAAPAVERRAEEAVGPPAADAATAVRGRILIVDDEALVGRAVSRILSPQHDVVTRTSARAALDDVAGGGGGFDLVLCDLMMPDMNGMELHSRLREIAPALADRTVFLTGGAFTASAREFLARLPNARIEKPFEPDALRALAADLDATLAAVLSGQAADAALAAFLRARPALSGAARAASAEAVLGVGLWRRRLLAQLGVASAAPRLLLAALLRDPGGRDDAEPLAELPAGSLPPPSAPPPALADRFSLPDWLADALRGAAGDEAEALADALDRPGPIFLRANPLGTSRDALAARLRGEGVATRPGELARGCLEVTSPRPNVLGLAAYREGLFRSEEEGSQLL